MQRIVTNFLKGSCRQFSATVLWQPKEIGLPSCCDETISFGTWVNFLQFGRSFAIDHQGSASITGKQPVPAAAAEPANPPNKAKTETKTRTLFFMAALTDAGPLVNSIIKRQRLRVIQWENDTFYGTSTQSSERNTNTGRSLAPNKFAHGARL